MKKLFLSLIILTSTTGSVFAQVSNSNFDERVKSNLLQANLEFLASDELEGREAATRGEKLASLYISNELKKYGVKPFGDDGTYFQNFGMYSASLNPDSKIIIAGTELILGEDFATMGGRGFTDSYSNKSTGVVFAGFGITAPEYEYDDFENLNAAGKTVIAVLGEPYSENKDFFNGSAETEYSQWETKIRNARKHGASEVIIVMNSEIQSRYWQFMKKRSFAESLQMKENLNGSSVPMIVVKEETLAKLLINNEYSADEILTAIKSNDIPQPFELKNKFNFQITAEKEERELRNVVGIIEGSDPALKNEFIVVSAHYDHDGIKSGEVYNGADDNASGTVAVMEIGRLLAQSEIKRSVILCLFTAEEKGLIGSEYFTDKHLSMPNVLANVNLDMVARGSIDTIFCIGSRRLSNRFGDIVEEVNAETANYFLDYSLDRHFFRNSDHYSFHKKGKPVVFFFDNMMSDLHRPGDDVEKINFDKIVKSVKLAYGVTLEAANLEEKLLLEEKTETPVLSE